MHDVEAQFKNDFLRYTIGVAKFPDGRVDYTHAKTAIALNCFIFANDKLLLVKRSDKVGFLKNQWHVVGGFLDEARSVAAKAAEELLEETKITPEMIANISLHAPYHSKGSTKEWIIYPVRIDLIGVPLITLDWENTEYAWVDLKDVHQYHLIAEVLESLQHM